MPSSLLLDKGANTMKKIALRCALVLIVVAFLCVSVWGCYWFIHKDCLCYKAKFNAGKQWPIDATLLEYASPQSGVMQIQTIECKHGNRVWLNISEDTYWVQSFNK